MHGIWGDQLTGLERNGPSPLEDHMPGRRSQNGLHDPIIILEDISYRYEDGHCALQDLNFSVSRGDRIAILGPNGAGKSTLLHLIAGLIRPCSGTVRVLDNDIGNRKKTGFVPGVGIVFQDPDDQVFMPTVEEDIAFGPLNLGLDISEVERRVDDALRKTNMLEYRERVPHNLSMGEKKKVAMAGVLAMEPGVLLLDEPTANLDPEARADLIRLLNDLDVTMIVATHDMNAALDLTSHAIILDRTILGEGSYSSLFMDQCLLKKARLSPPDLPRLFLEMKNNGTWSGSIPFTIKEAMAALSVSNRKQM